MNPTKTKHKKERKHMKKGHYPSVEEAVLKFIREQRSCQVMIRSVELLEAADRFAKLLTYRRRFLQETLEEVGNVTRAPEFNFGRRTALLLKMRAVGSPRALRGREGAGAPSPLENFENWKVKDAIWCILRQKYYTLSKLI